MECLLFQSGGLVLQQLGYSIEVAQKSLHNISVETHMIEISRLCVIPALRFCLLESSPGCSVITQWQKSGNCILRNPVIGDWSCVYSSLLLGGHPSNILLWA